MKVFYKSFFILSTAFIFLLTACSFIEEEAEVAFELKDCNLKSSDFLLVEYYDKEGFLKHKKIKACNKIYLNLEKGLVTSVLVKKLPSKKEDFSFGTIYPYSTDLTLSSSFAAEVFSGIMQASKSCKKESLDFLTYFNWSKFIEETSFYPNILYDKARIMKAIAAKTFKKSDLKALQK